MKRSYDLVIIGSGPAGLTAGIYASRYNLDYVILGKISGGALSEAHKICNYPSQNDISGIQLTANMVDHVRKLGGIIKQEVVLELNKEKDLFIIKTNKEVYSAKKIILATGREKQKLEVPGEDKFLGNGVSYCATCDAAFYKNSIVAVAGGGNTAVTAALLLAEHASKVYIIYRKDKFFRAEPAWVKQLEKEKKIQPIFNSNITEIYGKDAVEGIVINTKEKLKVDGVFIEIGFKPDTVLAEQLKLETEKGYIITDKRQKTNIKGVFAAGDSTNNHLKQIITASAEGAVAATVAYEELKLGETK